MTTQHARLAPSSAGRWVHCPASVTLSELYPQEETAESIEGTAAHWAASEAAAGRMIAVGQITPDGVTLTDEMIEGAELYAATVEPSITGLHIEEPVQIPYVHPTESWGTPDAWRWTHNATRGTGKLTVYDYKFGHRYVDAFECWQLVDYACGILDKLGIDGLCDQYSTVEFVIVQPRSYHRDGPVRRWSTPAANLRGRFNILQNAANKALAPDPMQVVNAECRDCNGRHACEAYARAAMEACDISTRSIPLELPPEALSLELRTLRRCQDILKGRITGMEGEIAALIRKGKRVPRFNLEPSQGRGVWEKPIAEVLTLAELMGVSLAKAAEAITPKQAIKAGIPEEVVRAYSKTPVGALKLVEVDDASARKIFGGST